MRVVDLPRPVSWERLPAAVADFHAQPLDLTKPLWEIAVIDGLGPTSW